MIVRPLIVLVCGGRDYNDAHRVGYALDHYRKHYGDFSKVIHGAARGADSLAGAWAFARGIAVQEFPADWNTHGRSAGHKRNRRMLEEGHPDLVVAFPGGRGTLNMIDQACRADVPVLVPFP